MKAKLIRIIAGLVTLTSHISAVIAAEENSLLLPSPFSVYTNGDIVINYPAIGFDKKLLPTNNDYSGSPGCYVACYTHDKQAGIYSVGEGIYVVGQVRVAGEYQERTCIATNYAGTDISKDEHFKTICNEKITACAQLDQTLSSKCWAGGDTGGWFGIQ